MRADTLQVVWHSTDDKIQPVFSVDFHRDGTLATAGGDHDIRLWKVLTTKDGKAAVKPLCTLKNHASSVNAIRFSPEGDLLASAGDAGELLLWKPRSGEAPAAALPTFCEEGEEGEEGLWKYSATLRGHSSDIYDLAWSPDATALLSGSVENVALLWDVKAGKGKARLQDHKHFIQGVAWDPLGEMLVTQGADRSCRVYGPRAPVVGKKGGASARDASAVARVPELCCQAVLSKIRVAPGTGGTEGDKPVFDHLFRDENSFGFFKRPSWSPDGSILAVPAGRLRANVDTQFTEGAFLYKRGDWNKPVVHLPFPGEATMAVRFCPILFKLKDGSDGNPNIDLPYRMVFAVASTSSVAIYTTQDTAPLAFLGMLHYAPITDLAWSPDGLALVCSSQDGYCSIAQFEVGELGEPLQQEHFPPHMIVRRDSGKDAATTPAVVDAEPRRDPLPKALDTVGNVQSSGCNSIVPEAQRQCDSALTNNPTIEGKVADPSVACNGSIAAEMTVKRIEPQAVEGSNDGTKTVKRIEPQAVEGSNDGKKTVKRIVPQAVEGSNDGKAMVKRIEPQAVEGSNDGTKTVKRIVPQAMDGSNDGKAMVKRIEPQAMDGSSDGRTKVKRIVPQAVEGSNDGKATVKRIKPETVSFDDGSADLAAKRTTLQSNEGADAKPQVKRISPQLNGESVSQSKEEERRISRSVGQSPAGSPDQDMVSRDAPQAATKVHPTSETTTAKSALTDSSVPHPNAQKGVGGIAALAAMMGNAAAACGGKLVQRGNGEEPKPLRAGRQGDDENLPPC